MYNQYGEHYQGIFQNIAVDVLTEETTNYDANDFFKQRMTIKDNFEKSLRASYKEHCYSDIVSLQLRSVDLPNPFEKAIQDTEVKKQDINIAGAEQSKVQIEVDTLIKSAEFQKNVTINIAEGDAQAIKQQNQAQVESYKKVQDLQTNAYKSLKEKLALKNEDLLKMIKTQVIRDYNGSNLAMAISSPEPQPAK